MTTAIGDPQRRTLVIRSSPHIVSGASVDTIMFHVVVALLPISAFAIYAFGLTALTTLGAAIVACVVAEALLNRVAGNSGTLGDWSAVVTGLLYGLTLPPGLPLWMVAVGGFLAIGVGKFLFGGLGYNPFNPALVGRAMLQAAFPVAMTTWLPALTAGRFARLPSSALALPFCEPTYDVLTGPTPLSAWKFDHVAEAASDLALGYVSGSTGETCAVLILLGGVYLALRRMMSWRIPVAILATVALLSAVLHAIEPARYASAPFMLLSGGLMLGAVFMATDMVSSPMTHPGAIVYGVVIGALVVVIRTWGGMPEGVMYAILLGNALTPLIDQQIRPRTYGHAHRQRKAGGA
ncbi:MAG: RnfABCDGE type electron transport complex subunit D [Planctomycetes bacterium]|nr:RnfABCDGE type electron transport complex subunit D [Planctomycetota bacterium]